MRRENRPASWLFAVGAALNGGGALGGLLITVSRVPRPPTLATVVFCAGTAVLGGIFVWAFFRRERRYCASQAAAGYMRCTHCGEECGEDRDSMVRLRPCLCPRCGGVVDPDSIQFDVLMRQMPFLDRAIPIELPTGISEQSRNHGR
jgi:hypothetical protein